MILVTLGEDGINSGNRLIRYLSLLLSNEKPLEERKQQMETEYRIPMTDELDKEMSCVCNIGEAIREKGREEGRKEGRKEGENRLVMLNRKLKELGRIEDILATTEDKQYREKLYKEFKLA